MKDAVYLIRHAQAGDRRRWEDLDLLRPLNRAGARQADALVGTLREAAVTRLLSSPYVRCVQTLEPMAAERDLPIEVSEDLAEGTPVERALALVERASVGAVLCSHGDVIEGALLALRRRGVLGGSPLVFPKGSVWELHREGGRVVGARYLSPP